MFWVHKSPCKSKEFSYTVWIIFSGLSLFYYCSPVNYFATQMTDWNYQCTWAESNKWPLQVTLITSGEALTQNTDMAIKMPHLSLGNYLLSSPLNFPRHRCTEDVRIWWSEHYICQVFPLHFFLHKHTHRKYGFSRHINTTKRGSLFCGTTKAGCICHGLYDFI